MPVIPKRPDIQLQPETQLAMCTVRTAAGEPKDAGDDEEEEEEEEGDPEEVCAASSGLLQWFAQAQQYVLLHVSIVAQRRS